MASRDERRDERRLPHGGRGGRLAASFTSAGKEASGGAGHHTLGGAYTRFFNPTLGITEVVNQRLIAARRPAGVAKAALRSIRESGTRPLSARGAPHSHSSCVPREWERADPPDETPGAPAARQASGCLASDA